MGSYDGAEVCELIGIFILSLIGNKYNPNNIGLYRDDGLAVFRNTSGPQSEKIKKTFQKMFKNKGLDIIISFNMKIVNYIDVTLDRKLNLKDGSYRPYKKPNEEANYIHANSDHLHQNTPSKNVKHCNCQQKENCPMNSACFKESLVYYATISCNDKNDNRNYTKEVVKQVLRSSIVTTKNHLTYHCTNMIPSYQQSIGT